MRWARSWWSARAEPSRPLVLIRYGNFYGRAANGYAGRMMLVGSDLTCVRPVGAYVRVRNGGAVDHGWTADDFDERRAPSSFVTPMPNDEIVCRKLGERDVAATAAVLARAFADNPAYAWMHPRRATRARDLEAFFVRNLHWHLPLDLTWVAARGDAVLGTSTLEPPGGVPSGLRAAVAHWVVPTVRNQGLRTFVRTLSADREFRTRYRTLTRGRAYYHLHAVAVAPEGQGRGIGTTLVAAALREWELRSARDGAPIVVSTQRERNLPLYERAGFVLESDAVLGEGLARRGYRTWFMTREAARAS